MKIFLATWLEDNQGLTLTKAKGMRRLLSYHFIRTDPKGASGFDLKCYVESGKLNPNRKIIKTNKFKRGRLKTCKSIGKN